MAYKYAPDAMIDYSLNYVAGSATRVCVCSGMPASFADAFTTNILAGLPMVSGCVTGPADHTSGRKITIVARTGASITSSATASSVALVNVASSTLLYVTSCTEQALTDGGSVDIPEWTISIADPT